MAMSTRLPATVIGNRGFGPIFWGLLLVIPPAVAVSLLLFIAQYPDDTNRAAIALLLAPPFLLVALVIPFIHRWMRPRVTFDVAGGAVVVRGRRTPVTDIAQVVFDAQVRPERWVTLRSASGRDIARVAMANTVFAAPGALQWAALAHVLQVASGRAAASGRIEPAMPDAVSVAEAISVLHAQSAWCHSGNRSNASGTPVTALLGRTVGLR